MGKETAHGGKHPTLIVDRQTYCLASLPQRLLDLESTRILRQKTATGIALPRIQRHLSGRLRRSGDVTL